MAVTTRHISILQQAKARRIALPRYVGIGGSGYLLGLVVLVCLMSLIALAQTGVVATKGYAIAELEAQRIHLMRERTQLQVRQAQAQSLDQVRQRAAEIGLRPMTKDQVRYIAVPLTTALPPANAAAAQPKTDAGATDAAVDPARVSQPAPSDIAPAETGVGN